MIRAEDFTSGISDSGDDELYCPGCGRDHPILIDFSGPLRATLGTLLGQARQHVAEHHLVELTAVEADTLRLIANGLTDAEIAAQMFMSETAIKSRGQRIRAKFGARDRAHAVAIGYQLGLIGGAQ